MYGRAEQRALLPSSCNKSLSVMIGSSTRTSVRVENQTPHPIVYARTTTPFFTTACHLDTRSSRPHLQPTLQTTQLGPSPLPNRPMFVAVLCAQRAPSRTCNIHSIRVWGAEKASVVRGYCSLDDRGTHLRHSSSFHRPPSLRCASVELDIPGAYGAPGSSRRLSA